MQRLRSALLTVLLLVSTLLASVNVQQLHPTIGAAERQALIAAATYTTDSDRATELLTQAGYIPSGTGWREYPAVRKLETAYLAAETAQTGGGSRLLARVTSLLGETYPVRHDAALKALVGADDGVPIRYAPLVLAGGRVADFPTQTQILALAKYADAGAVGGAQGILQFYFEVPDQIAYDILRTSNTTAEALQRGWNWVPEAQRNPALARLVGDFQAIYPTVRHDPHLRPYLEGATPTVAAASAPVVSPRDPQPRVTGLDVERPTGTRAAELRSETAKGYLSFVKDLFEHLPAVAPTPGVRVPSGGGGGGIGFTRMVGAARGFGGVVVGNQVTGTPDLGTPQQVLWIGPRNGVGRVEVVRADAPPLVMTAVSAEEAIAAARIVFTGIDGVTPAPAGEGVGLVGVLADRSECADVEAPMRWFRIVMHPGIATLPLGRVVLAADTLPISERRAELADELRVGMAAGVADEIRTLFAEHEVVTWKIIDRETRIERTGNVVRVVDAAGGSPTVLSMNAFTEGESDEQRLIAGFATAFAPVAARLTESSDTYARLNHLFKVLALFRWARQGGAAWGGNAIASSVNPPGSVLLSNGRAYLAIGRTIDDARNELRDRLRAQLTSTEPLGSVAFVRFQQDLEDLVGQIEEMDDSVLDAWLTRMKASRPDVYARYARIAATASESLRIFLRDDEQDEAREAALVRYLVANAAMDAMREENPIPEDRNLRQLEARREALFAGLGNTDTMRWTASCLAHEE